MFCGCGGFSKGFEDAGIEILYGVDINKDALESFELNHKNSVGLSLDLSSETSFELFV